MKNIVIAGYARSPFTPAKKGQLAGVRPDELAAQVIKDLIKNCREITETIEDVILGCAFPEAEQGLNLGRMVGFLAGLPLPIAGVTVNRFCGSSMQAIHMAAGAIQLGAGEAFICGGVESMSRVPIGGYNFLPHPRLCETFPQAYMSMGQTAENLARRYEISRHQQERFALASHQKAAAARTKVDGAREIVVIERGETRIESDGCIRPDTSLEALEKLEPAFDRSGTVTAGTAAPLTDGAAALLVCAEDYAEKKGLTILARIKSVAVAGCAPELMGIGPVLATRKALDRARLTLNEIDVIEINEAFAAQVLACAHELKIDMDKLNREGGALALGHPLGASGARITGQVALLMKKHQARYALATMCIGGGQGIATILEAV